jgi:hypothetical protein
MIVTKGVLFDRMIGTEAIHLVIPHRNGVLARKSRKLFAILCHNVNLTPGGAANEMGD